MEAVAASNQESHEAWNGVLYDRWMQYRHIVTTGLDPHGQRALALHPPKPGDRALDIGCGTGETTNQVAEAVGAEGEVLGVDVSERMIETATREAEEAGAANVRFEVGDAQVADLGGPYAYVYSRMGVMFFAQPVVALRNIREAMSPGAQLCMAVWRQKLDNAWVNGPEQLVKGYVEEDEDSEEPTCGPGPFSMANADTVSAQLLNAGFEEVELHRCDLPISMGDNLDEAVAFAMALGPAGEALRLADPDEAKRLAPKITADLRELLSEYAGPDGVNATASTWIVAARVPDAAG